MIRVLVADDHAIVRRGLMQVVAETPDLELAAEAADGNEVVAFVRQRSFDVAILDLNMPGPSGLDLIKLIQSERPDLPILILSAHPEEQFGVRVLKAGAAGFLHKESAPEQLIAAVRRVAQGQRYVTPAVAEKLLTQFESGHDGPAHERLSDREFQVLRMIGQGRTVSQIAEDLSLSVKTVSTYRTRVLDKMSMGSNAEITRYVIEQKLD